MQRTTWLVIGMLLCLTGSTTGVVAQGKGKPGPPPIPVSAQFVGSLSLQSDGDVYEDTSDIKNQISPINGDWELNLSAQTTRTIYLNFVPFSGPPIPSGLYNARVFSRCFDPQDNISGFLAIPEGGVNTSCSLRVEFTSDGKHYLLVMSPTQGGSDPETGTARVTCNAADVDGVCEQWTVEPAEGTYATLANLYEVARNGRQTFKGSYYNMYDIVVTR